MPAGFDAAFAKAKELVADFRSNEKFHLSPAFDGELQVTLPDALKVPPISQHANGRKSSANSAAHTNSATP